MDRRSLVGHRFKRLRALLAVAVIGAGLVAVGSASGVTTQAGPNNYAGPLATSEGDCAAANAAFSVDFGENCTPDNNVTQSSTGGLNVFEVATAGPGGTVVQNNGPGGTNKAFCVLDQSVNNNPNSTTNQLCDIEQNTGTNTTVVDVKASQSYSDTLGLQQLSQDAVMTVKVAQNSIDNDNTVSGVGGGAALLRTNQTLNSDVQIAQQQRQERLILLDVDQIATGNGDNATDFNIDTDQSGVARGRSPDQGQDIRTNGADDPNAKAYIYQRSATGMSHTKGRGTDEKRLEATSIDSALGGAATQKQWHAAGGFDIVADVDSSGGTVDFGTPYAEGTDCLLVDGFRKIGTIETYAQTLPLPRTATTAGTRSQDDGLPIGIPGLSPHTATTASCSKLDAPAGTFQHAGLSVKGHAKQAITGTMSAALNSGGTTSGYRAFEDQTVNEVLDCTRNTPNTCTTTSGGVTGSGIDITANEDESFTKDVAEYTNANSSNPVTSATINWGDSSSSAGTITGTSVYKVSGTHTYADPGTYTITTTVTQQDSSTATFTSTATVSDVIEVDYVVGGSFVIGDKAGQFGDASVGSNVTFWSQSWNPPNPMTSGKLAPPSFKGWQNSLIGAGNVTCGRTWTTTGGNSPPPPPGALPTRMAVIVASNVGKSGNNPTGNVVHVVVVDTTGTTYSPNPSADGTGVITDVIC
jgi:hypothetical protein